MGSHTAKYNIACGVTVDVSAFGCEGQREQVKYSSSGAIKIVKGAFLRLTFPAGVPPNTQLTFSNTKCVNIRYRPLFTLSG